MGLDLVKWEMGASEMSFRDSSRTGIRDRGIGAQAGTGE